jgi:hypothetical protein
VKFDEDRRRKFLEFLAASGNVTRAARAIGLTRARIYQVRGEEPEFAKAMDEALDESRDELEAEAWRRGKDGYDEPVVSMGRIVTDSDGNPLLVKKYSDTLLVTLLKAHHPAKYRDRASVDMTTGGKPLEPSDAKQQFAASIERLAERLGKKK